MSTHDTSKLVSAFFDKYFEASRQIDKVSEAVANSINQGEQNIVDSIENMETSVKTKIEKVNKEMPKLKKAIEKFKNSTEFEIGGLSISKKNLKEFDDSAEQMLKTIDNVMNNVQKAATEARKVEDIINGIDLNMSLQDNVKKSIPKSSKKEQEYLTKLLTANIELEKTFKSNLNKVYDEESGKKAIIFAQEYKNTLEETLNIVEKIKVENNDLINTSSIETKLGIVNTAMSNKGRIIENSLKPIKSSFEELIDMANNLSISGDTIVGKRPKKEDYYKKNLYKKEVNTGRYDIQQYLNWDNDNHTRNTRKELQSLFYRLDEYGKAQTGFVGEVQARFVGLLSKALAEENLDIKNPDLKDVKEKISGYANEKALKYYKSLVDKTAQNARENYNAELEALANNVYNIIFSKPAVTDTDPSKVTKEHQKIIDILNKEKLESKEIVSIFEEFAKLSEDEKNSISNILGDNKNLKNLLGLIEKTNGDLEKMKELLGLVGGQGGSDINDGTLVIPEKTINKTERLKELVNKTTINFEELKEILSSLPDNKIKSIATALEMAMNVDIDAWKMFVEKSEMGKYFTFEGTRSGAKFFLNNDGEFTRKPNKNKVSFVDDKKYLGKDIEYNDRRIASLIFDLRDNLMRASSNPNIPSSGTSKEIANQNQLQKELEDSIKLVEGLERSLNLVTNGVNENSSSEFLKTQIEALKSFEENLISIEEKVKSLNLDDSLKSGVLGNISELKTNFETNIETLTDWMNKAIETSTPRNLEEDVSSFIATVSHLENYKSADPQWLTDYIDKIRKDEISLSTALDEYKNKLAEKMQEIADEQERNRINGEQVQIFVKEFGDTSSFDEGKLTKYGEILSQVSSGALSAADGIKQFKAEINTTQQNNSGLDAINEYIRKSEEVFGAKKATNIDELYDMYQLMRAYQRSIENHPGTEAAKDARKFQEEIVALNPQLERLVNNWEKLTKRKFKDAFGGSFETTAALPLFNEESTGQLAMQIEGVTEASWDLGKAEKSTAEDMSFMNTTLEGQIELLDYLATQKKRVIKLDERAKASRNNWAWGDMGQFHENDANDRYQQFLGMFNTSEMNEQQVAYFEQRAKNFAGLITEMYNDQLRREANNPSSVFTGGSNFNVNKFYKKQDAMMKKQEEYEQKVSRFIENTKKGLKELLSEEEQLAIYREGRWNRDDDKIATNDPLALKKHEAKLEFLEKEHAEMLAYNKEAKKVGKEKLPSWKLAYSSRAINEEKKTIEALKQLAEQGTEDIITAFTDGTKLIRSAVDNRIKFKFDGKPDDETRNLLKSNGFKWASKEGVWQRQWKTKNGASSNSEYSTKRIIEQLKLEEVQAEQTAEAEKKLNKIRKYNIVSRQNTPLLAKNSSLSLDEETPNAEKLVSTYKELDKLLNYGTKPTFVKENIEQLSELASILRANTDENTILDILTRDADKLKKKIRDLKPDIDLLKQFSNIDNITSTDDIPGEMLKIENRLKEIRPIIDSDKQAATEYYGIQMKLWKLLDKYANDYGYSARTFDKETYRNQAVWIQSLLRSMISNSGMMSYQDTENEVYKVFDEVWDTIFERNDIIKIKWNSRLKENVQNPGDFISLEKMAAILNKWNGEEGFWAENSFDKDKSELKEILTLLELIKENKESIYQTQPNEDVIVSEEKKRKYNIASRENIPILKEKNEVQQTTQAVQELTKAEIEAAQKAKEIGLAFGITNKNALKEIQDVLLEYNKSKNINTLQEDENGFLIAPSFENEFDLFTKASIGFEDVLDTISKHIKSSKTEIDGYINSWKEVRKFVSSSKISISESVKSEFGDDYNRMRTTIGMNNLKTDGSGTDIITFLGEINECLGTTFDLTQSNQGAFRELYEFLKNKPLAIDPSTLPESIREVVNQILDGTYMPINQRRNNSPKIKGAKIERSNQQQAEESSSSTPVIVENEKKQQEAYENTAKAKQEEAETVEESNDRIIKSNEKANKSYDNISNKLGLFGGDNNNNDNSKDINFDVNEARVLKQVETAMGIATVYKTLEGQIATVVNGKVLSISTSFEELRNQAKKSLDVIMRLNNELRNHKDKYGDNFDTTAYENSIEKETLKLESYVTQAQIYATDSRYALEAEQVLRDYTEVKNNILDKQARADSVYSAKVLEKHEKEISKLDQLKSQYNKKLSSINNVFSYLTEYSDVQTEINNLVSIDDVSSVETAFNKLENVINNFKQNVKSSASLDPVFATIKKKNDLDNIVEGYKLSFEQIGFSSDEASKKVSNLLSISSKMKKVDLQSSNGMILFGEEVRKFNVEEDKIKNLIKITKQRQQVYEQNYSAIQKYEQAHIKLNELYMKEQEKGSSAKLTADIEVQKKAVSELKKEAIDASKEINKMFKEGSISSEQRANALNTLIDAYRGNTPSDTALNTVKQEQQDKAVKNLEDLISKLEKAGDYTSDLQEKATNLWAELNKTDSKDNLLQITEEIKNISEEFDQLKTAHDARIQKQKEIQAQYDKNIDTIKQLEIETDKLNNMMASDIGKNKKSNQIEDQLNKTIEAAENAKRAIEDVDQMFKDGNISKGQQMDAGNKYREAKQGSTTSQARYEDAKASEAKAQATKNEKAAVDNLKESLNNLISAYTHLTSVSTKPGENSFTNALEQVNKSRTVFGNMYKAAQDAGINSEQLLDIQQNALVKLNESVSQAGAKAFDSYITKIDEAINKLRSLGQLTPEAFNEFSDLAQRLKNANLNKDLSSFDGIQKYIQNIAKYSSIVDEEVRRISQSSQIGYFETQITELDQMNVKSVRFISVLEQVKQRLKEFSNFKAQTSDKQLISDKEVQLIKQLSPMINELYKEAQGKGTLIPESIGKVTDIDSLKKSMINYAESLGYTKQVSQGVVQENGQLTISFKNSKGEILKMTGSIDALNQGLRETSTVSKMTTGFVTNLKVSFKQMLGYFTRYYTGYMMMTRAIGAFRDGINIVKEFDAAMTELIKVSNESEEVLRKFGSKRAFDIASSIGGTGKDVINSAADWERLGYSIEEADELAKNSILYSKVGDMDIDTATEHLVSTLKAYKEFDAKTSQLIVDKFNEIGLRKAYTCSNT